MNDRAVNKRPVTIGIPLDLYDALKERAFEDLEPYESMSGALQRWVIEACKIKLGTVPTAKARGNGLPPMPKVSFREAYHGGVEEIRGRLAYLKWSAGKPGQYPPVRSRMESEILEWEKELSKREHEATHQPVVQELGEPPEPDATDDYQGDDIV